MTDKSPTMAFLPANVDGCALYRMYIPHVNIPRSKYIFKPGGVGMEMFGEAQVVVVQRQVSKENLAALQQLRAVGYKIIYDTDDNLWSLPSANPGKKTFEQHKAGFGICALACDLITVSTKGLKTAVKTAIPEYKKEILVCPNAVDFNMFQPARVTKDPDKVVIGWAGSNTHNEDVKEAWDVLPDIVEAHANVYLEFIGTAPPKSLLGHPRVTIRRFVPAGEYPSRLSSWGWDITMAPLVENRFNKSKSCIKMLEASAIGIPCLASSVQPYDEFCSFHPELRYLLCMGSRQWKTKLKDLIHDADRRNYLAKVMHEVTYEWFNISTIKDNWIHAAGVALNS